MSEHNDKMKEVLVLGEDRSFCLALQVVLESAGLRATYYALEEVTLSRVVETVVGGPFDVVVLCWQKGAPEPVAFLRRISGKDLAPAVIVLAQDELDETVVRGLGARLILQRSVSASALVAHLHGLTGEVRQTVVEDDGTNHAPPPPAAGNIIRLKGWKGPAAASNRRPRIGQRQ